MLNKTIKEEGQGEVSFSYHGQVKRQMAPFLVTKIWNSWRQSSKPIHCKIQLNHKKYWYKDNTSSVISNPRALPR